MTFYRLPPPKFAGDISVQGLVTERPIDMKEVARLIEQIDFVGYESKGQPLELDPDFKRLAEIFGAKI